MTPRACRPAAVLLALATVATSGSACPLAPTDGTLKVGDGGLVVAWRFERDVPPAVGEPFVLIVRACPATAELLAVDATMPAHRHGMNYRPSLTPAGAGRWRVEGLLWHMAGGWELALTLRSAGTTQTLREAVNLR